MITVASDYVIRDGQTIRLSATTAYDYANLYPGIVYATDHLAANFTDGGQVSISGSQGVVAGFYVHNSTEYDPVGEILFQSTSIFQVVSGNRSGTAVTYGVYSPYQTIDLTNEGLIKVQAVNGSAFGVFTDDSRPTLHGVLTLRNDGEIDVTSGGDAVGIFFRPVSPHPEPFTVSNTGRVEAYGERSAIGIHVDVLDAVNLLNDGDITASAGAQAETPTVGISITAAYVFGAFAGLGDRGSYIANGGTITADRAIYVVSVNGADLVNAGSVHGAVSLTEGNDRVLNTGDIVGDVSLGSGSDLLLIGLSGTQSGVVSGGAGDDVLVGGALGETLLGGSDSDQIAGGGGDDWIDGGRGADALSGGGGRDTLNYSNSTHAINANLAKGKVADDSRDRVTGFEGLIGTVYADKVTGGRAAERLEGLASDDVLAGGAGADTLLGGTGNDRLSGGAAADTFVFSAGGGKDVVADFDPRLDRLEIHGYTGWQSVRAVGSDLLLTLSAGDSILLLDTTSAAFSGAHVSFTADPLAPEVQRLPEDRLIIDRPTHVAVGSLIDIFANPTIGPAPAGAVAFVMEWGADAPSTLWNEGRIHIEGHSDEVLNYAFNGIAQFGGDQHRLPERNGYATAQQFLNDKSGVIEVINSGVGSTHGVDTTATRYAFNLGHIDVQSIGGAGGVSGNALVNRGVISVSSDAGLASGAGVFQSSVDVGLNVVNALWNSGQILVHGHAASSGASGPIVVNSGVVTVTDDTADLDSIGLSANTVWNSGTVTADIAVQGNGFALYNTGVLNGEVVCVQGAQIRNIGMIHGDLNLGTYGDVFDGRGGQVDGTVYGRGGPDLLIGGSFDDRLDASGGINGNGLDVDTLCGGAGDDTLTGGQQSDSFYFAAGDGHDVITDFGAQRRDDTIVLVGLSRYQSVEQVGADTLIHLTDSDDVLLKNYQAADLKSGFFRFDAAPLADAKDIPKAPKAPDAPTLGGSEKTPDLVSSLDGTDGADTLDATGGSMVMAGDAGGDTYLVDNANDRVLEAMGGGDDLVISSSRSYRLDPQIERLTLTGSALNGFGNASDNLITGDERANHLEGGSGDDTLVGGAGDDTLVGGDGSDVLDGGAGRDVMYGSMSVERWVFRTGDTSNDAATADVIADFVFDGGKVDVSGMRPEGAAFSWLGKGAFTGHALELRYDPVGSTDTIQGDVDGDGRSDFIIILDPPTPGSGPADLRAHDFVL